MTDTPMPDFADALERELRRQATTDDPRSMRSRRARPRIATAVALTSIAALVVVIVAASTSSHHESPRASDKPQDTRPLILKTAAVDASNVIDEVRSGGLAKLVLGANPPLTEARPVPAFGGVAYVITGDNGWCLVAPDAAIDLKADPARRGGLTCQTLDTINRVGIALIVGHNAIAALPQGVPAPTLTTNDGTTSELKPSDQGVVTVENGPPGAVLTLHSRDGQPLPLHFR